MKYDRLLKVTNNNNEEIILKIGDTIDIELTNQVAKRWLVEENKLLIGRTIIDFCKDSIRIKATPDFPSDCHIYFDEITNISFY